MSPAFWGFCSCRPGSQTLQYGIAKIWQTLKTPRRPPRQAKAVSAKQTKTDWHTKRNPDSAASRRAKGRTLRKGHTQSLGRTQRLGRVTGGNRTAPFSTTKNWPKASDAIKSICLDRSGLKIDQLHRHSFWASLRWAVRGLYYAFRTQRNFRIELALAVCTLALGLFFGIARAEWSIILLSVCLVLASELANTALEYMVDLYEKKFDYLAMMAKDIAAACVLLSSIHALVQGVLVFGPYVADIVKKAFLPL